MQLCCSNAGWEIGPGDFTLCAHSPQGSGFAAASCTAICTLRNSSPVLQVLEQLMDRSFLEEGRKAPYPSSGPGWQVVAQMDSSGLLKGVE